PVDGASLRPAPQPPGQSRARRARPAVDGAGARPAMAAAVDGRDRLRVGVDPVAALRDALRQPAGVEDGRVHGHLQLLHRDPAAGGGEHAGRAAVEAVRRRPDAHPPAGRRLPDRVRPVRAAGARRRARTRRGSGMNARPVLAAALACALAACAGTPAPRSAPSPAHAAPLPDYYGTLEPFASDAVYFVLTDRFVNG